MNNEQNNNTNKHDNKKTLIDNKNVQESATKVIFQSIKKRGRPKKNNQFDDIVISNEMPERNIILYLKLTYEEYLTYKNNIINSSKGTNIHKNEIALRMNDVFSQQKSTKKSTVISLAKNIPQHNKIIRKPKIIVDILNCPFEIDKNNHIIVPAQTNLCCLWDTCKIKGYPYFLPIRYENNIFYVQAWFCSLNCATAYNININDNKTNERYSLLKFMYEQLDTNIIPSPDFKILKKYGGKYNIQEYRKKFTNNQIGCRLITPPMTFISLLLEERII